jgi:hypothetical protein
MSHFDLNKLTRAVENEDNKCIIDLDNQIIKTQKNNILQQMQFKGEKLKELHCKLKDYRYIDEVNELRYGSYLRWINLNNPDNLKLTNGAYLCDIKINDDGIQLLCKTAINRMVQFKIDECVIFQKNTDQEKILLKALDYLNK